MCFLQIGKENRLIIRKQPFNLVQQIVAIYHPPVELAASRIRAWCPKTNYLERGTEWSLKVKSIRRAARLQVYFLPAPATKYAYYLMYYMYNHKSLN